MYVYGDICVYEYIDIFIYFIFEDLELIYYYMVLVSLWVYGDLLNE